MTPSSAGPAGVYKCSGRHDAMPWSEDSVSIKSHDNRAWLIPLPIINARIKLDLSDESTQRSLVIASIARIMIWIIYRKDKKKRKRLLLFWSRNVERDMSFIKIDDLIVCTIENNPKYVCHIHWVVLNVSFISILAYYGFLTSQLYSWFYWW